MGRILLVDDDNSLREVVQFILTDAGHEVLPAADGPAGLELLAREPDLVITDIRMPGMDGMEVLRRVRETRAAPPVIMLTAHGTVEQAVEAMQLGAFTYLLKPFAREELKLTVEKALHTRSLEMDNVRLRRLLKQRAPESGMVFNSRLMADLMEMLRRVAPNDATVLIAGRWDKPFITVNCGAIPGTLMESELFGHVKGAFTGAGQAARGRIRAAQGGTLFLDEIGELPLDLQPKLLRVLDTKQVDPVGGTHPVDVDFRLVCATHRDLEVETAQGRFREDLLFRVNVLQLAMPPLRDRPEDVGPLWDHFTRLHGGQDLVTDPDLLAALEGRPWRGNVRELKNLNQRLVLMRQADTLTLADLERLAPRAGDLAPATAGREEMEGGLPLGPLPAGGLSLVALEKEVIRRALDLCGGNRSKTAAYLGIPRHVLVYRINKYEIG